MAEQFGELEAAGIGEGVTQLLREWTLDIRKAILDAENDENCKGDPTVAIGFKVKLVIVDEKIHSFVDVKFATGKKISDTAAIAPAQQKFNS
jgi:hypothetical protein